MIPLHGEATVGEEVLPFLCPFGPEEGLSLHPGFGMEEGSKKRNPIRISVRRDGNRWDPTQRKRKGEETSGPIVNTKRAEGKQSHQLST